MKISYNWLKEYLPEVPDPKTLSDILTSIGLEVEKMESYEEVKGGLEGLVIGEVLEVDPHPNADRLKITLVDTGNGEPLRIVCGAPNVARRQKVVVAPVGATIYPSAAAPVTMKAARIRGEESLGMICAADEIGLGDSHDGILVLEAAARPGTPARDYFELTGDWVYEIGLTPNRMDAMSHMGVARDVCAWLSNRKGNEVNPVIVPVDQFKVDDTSLPFTVEVENTIACPRYAGISLGAVKIGESPDWLKKRLKSIGVRPINNVVDITNFVLHEVGQPLHAFDADQIRDRKIIVRNLPGGSSFVTLDGKERKLHPEDLMITDPAGGLCIAGVFGGMDSGVTEKTTRIFLESACFNPTMIRRTSFRHDLRTDAATRFEKGVDISGVIYALKRAANLMKELAGAVVTSEIADVYPSPQPRTRVAFTYDYLSRISGKDYQTEQVTAILGSLGFELSGQDAAGFVAAVPYSKPDITLAADLAEEVMRIDGYDNIAIPTHIRLAPSLTEKSDQEAIGKKISGYLTGAGFFEIFTNSITNSQYYVPDQPLIRLMNSLSTELDVMRPSLLETGLEAVAYNLNRKQRDLLFFERGKTYLPSDGHYKETEYLALFLSGNKTPEGWLLKPAPLDQYFLKGHLDNLFLLLGIPSPSILPVEEEPTRLQSVQHIHSGNHRVGRLGAVNPSTLQRFGIRQPVFYAELDWKSLISQSGKSKVVYRDIPRYPSMRRDLALILDKEIPFARVQEAAQSVKSGILQTIHLFDVFESDKIGPDKKSFALGFTFLDARKTLTDKEIDKVMLQLVKTLEHQLNAEIRKG